jgi:hypothetical protein
MVQDVANHIFAVAAATRLLDDIRLVPGGLEINLSDNFRCDLAAIGSEHAIAANDLVGRFRSVLGLRFLNSLHDSGKLGSGNLANCQGAKQSGK